MAKEKGFLEQVRDARREVENWSPLRKEAVQLEGRANYDYVVRGASDAAIKTVDQVPNSNRR